MVLRRRGQSGPHCRNDNMASIGATCLAVALWHFCVGWPQLLLNKPDYHVLIRRSDPGPGGGEANEKLQEAIKRSARATARGRSAGSERSFRFARRPWDLIGLRYVVATQVLGQHADVFSQPGLMEHAPRCIPAQARLWAPLPAVEEAKAGEPGERQGIDGELRERAECGRRTCSREYREIPRAVIGHRTLDHTQDSHYTPRWKFDAVSCVTAL